MFWRKGYAATSVEDLLAALGLSRSSLYGTFGDKRALFLEALALYSQRVLARTARTLAEAASPAAGVQTLFAELAEGVGGVGGTLGCFMVNSVAELAPHDQQVTEMAAGYNAAMQQLLAAAFAAALAARPAGGAGPRPATPAQLAVFVFNALQGARLLIKAGATREQVQAIGALTVAALK